MPIFIIFTIGNLQQDQDVDYVKTSLTLEQLKNYQEVQLLVLSLQKELVAPSLHIFE